MRKSIFLVVVLLFISSAAYVQIPPRGYIGLFTDEKRKAWCVSGSGIYPVEMWVFCLPSYHGQICAEFRVCNPANVINSTITWNTPIISVTLGDPDAGLSVCYIECQWIWHWIYHRQYWVLDTNHSYIEVCPHPDVGTYQFANCESGYPVEPCWKLTNFYINYEYPAWVCGCMGTEDASWSAIKSMISK